MICAPNTVIYSSLLRYSDHQSAAAEITSSVLYLAGSIQLGNFIMMSFAVMGKLSERSRLTRSVRKKTFNKVMKLF